MKSIALVVRALNEGAHIGRLLDAAQSQTVPPDRIILVDSGSTDDTVKIAQAHGAEVVRISPADFSFGRALNLGGKHASEDLLVFASAHVYPIDDRWLERLVAPFDDQDVALTYGGQTGDERTQFSEFQVMRRWFPDVSDPDQRHPFCNNANCAVRRIVWEELPYDEELTGLEDLDWANRARVRGHRLAYVADATVIHVHEESFAQTVNRYRREAIAHKRLFGDQRMGALEAGALFVANVLRDCAAATLEGELLANATSIPRFRAAQFWGSYQGFRQSGNVEAALKRRFYYPNGFRAAKKQTGESSHA